MTKKIETEIRRMRLNQRKEGPNLRRLRETQRLAAKHALKVPKVYQLTNRAGRKIYVLAIDASDARQFAVWNGHVESKKNASAGVFETDADKHFGHAWASISRAIREKRQGVFEVIGNHILIGDEVVSPLNSID